MDFGEARRRRRREVDCRFLGAKRSAKKKLLNDPAAFAVVSFSLRECPIMLGQLSSCERNSAAHRKRCRPFHRPADRRFDGLYSGNDNNNDWLLSAGEVSVQLNEQDREWR